MEHVPGLAIRTFELANFMDLFDRHELIEWPFLTVVCAKASGIMFVSLLQYLCRVCRFHFSGEFQAIFPVVVGNFVDSKSSVVSS